MHELGLLFYYYLLKKRGHKIVYLGQSVPFGDLGVVAAARPVDVVFTYFGSNITGDNLNEYVQRLASLFPKKKVVFSCFEGLSVSRKLPENVILVKNSTGFLRNLETITA